MLYAKSLNAEIDLPPAAGVKTASYLGRSPVRALTQMPPSDAPAPMRRRAAVRRVATQKLLEKSPGRGDGGVLWLMHALAVQRNVHAPSHRKILQVQL
jgi:hypothetical protein